MTLFEQNAAEICDSIGEGREPMCCRVPTVYSEALNDVSRIRLTIGNRVRKLGARLVRSHARIRGVQTCYSPPPLGALAPWATCSRFGVIVDAPPVEAGPSNVFRGCL
jgi:hypothetical protein